LRTRYFNPPRKLRTREHVLADLSANHVEKYALQCGFAVERVWQDYGLDLAVFTFDERGCLESGIIWFQLKATDHVAKSSDGMKVRLRLEKRDLLAWIGEVYPVILVVYDAVAEIGYWVSIQSYFSGTDAFSKLRGKTVTIAIPASNTVSANSMREFASVKTAILQPRGQRP
jgi:hypothetical protein